MKLPRPRGNAALTLMELLVVIAIIGILAALLLTVISKGKGMAQRISCVSNLHQFGIGLHNYLEGNHGYPILIDNNGGASLWYVQLAQSGVGSAQTSESFWTNGVWNCPTARWSKHFFTNATPRFSYAYNAGGLTIASSNGITVGELGLGGHYIPHSTKISATSESEVVAPSEMMALSDDFFGGSICARDSLAELEKFSNAQARHQGKANVVFCDGHVESPTLKFLFEDTSNTALSRWNRDHQPHHEKLAP